MPTYMHTCVYGDTTTSTHNHESKEVRTTVINMRLHVP